MNNTSTTRQRRAEKTRQAIINTALEILTEQGLDKLSLREIARRLDYTPAALYEYFSSKEEIVKALIVEADRIMTRTLEQVSREIPPFQRLIELGMAYIKCAQSHPALYLLYSSAPAPTPLNSRSVVQGGYSYLILKSVLKEGLEKGDFKLDPDLGLYGLSYASWALVHGIATLQLNPMKGILENPDKTHRKIIETMITGFLLFDKEPKAA